MLADLLAQLETPQPLVHLVTPHQVAAAVAAPGTESKPQTQLQQTIELRNLSLRWIFVDAKLCGIEKF